MPYRLLKKAPESSKILEAAIGWIYLSLCIGFSLRTHYQAREYEFVAGFMGVAGVALIISSFSKLLRRTTSVFIAFMASVASLVDAIHMGNYVSMSFYPCLSVLLLLCWISAENE